MSATGRVFIDGEFQTAGRVEPVLEAATGEKLGDGANATTAEVDAAVAEIDALLLEIHLAMLDLQHDPQRGRAIPAHPGGPAALAGPQPRASPAAGAAGAAAAGGQLG